MKQTLEIRKEKLYCTFCKGKPTIEIPINMDLLSPSSHEFVENIKCTICKNIGYVRV